MDAKREQKLTGAKRGAREKTRKATEKKHQKNVKIRPVKALAEDWQEEMWMTFGHDIKLMPWGKKEQNLARLLMVEMAVKMAQRFIRSWEEPGLPAFSYLWTRRESVLAQVKGQAPTRRSLIDTDEFDADKARKQPKVGW